MKQMPVRCTLRVALTVTAALAFCPMSAFAQDAKPEPVPTPAAAEGGIVEYKESECYSSAVRRSYVPAYTPHITSQFENPRDYPYALAGLATPYHMYGGCYNWFFSSPQGAQSSIPRYSQALAYHRGELDITSNLSKGYPVGQRVVESVLVPVPMSCRKTGYLIEAGKSALRVTDVTPTPAPVSPYYTPTPVPNDTGRHDGPQSAK